MTRPAGPEARHPSDQRLVWLDLEMTGLDPERDVILQAAVIVTDRELVPLEELSLDVWQPESALAAMTPFVRDMHEKTGLIARVRASTLDVARLEQRLLQVVAGWCTYPAMLAGNSIGQDRRFVDRHLPGLGRFLHYRMVDVSTIKTLARLWWGEGAVYDKPKDGAHDALFDVRQSIAELAFYRRTLFRGG